VCKPEIFPYLEEWYKGGGVNFKASGGCLGSVSERHQLYLMDPVMNLAMFVKKL